MVRRGLALAALLATATAAGAAEKPLPLFDTHVHYSESAWGDFPANNVIARLRAVGVTRALVSSTPDEGTLRLYRLAPDLVIPILRPYHGEIGFWNWFDKPEVGPYVEKRLARGIYKGIGEFHLIDAVTAGGQAARRMADLAEQYDIYLHIHAPASPIRALLAFRPKLKILWAHAGMTEPAEVVAALLAKHPNVVTEVSFRADDIAGVDSALDPAWRDLLLRFADRIMVGTDTYAVERWAGYRELIAAHRWWLKELPRDVAAAIAYKNAERLFGSPQAIDSPTATKKK